MPSRREGAALRKRAGEETELDMGLLEQSVGYRLRRAQLAIFARVTRDLQALELRPGQVGVLTLIERNPGLTQAEVCGALGIQRANLVTLINSLEARGIVERQAVADDRRSNALVVTERGKRLLRKAAEAHRSAEAAITRRLGVQGRDRLLAMLDLLAE
jgi:DNA-binding MarR family transcriptional regulator